MVMVFYRCGGRRETGIAYLAYAKGLRMLGAETKQNAMTLQQ